MPSDLLFNYPLFLNGIGSIGILSFCSPFTYVIDKRIYEIFLAVDCFASVASLNITAFFEEPGSAKKLHSYDVHCF